MNPVVQMVNKYKTYRLEKKDLGRIKRVKLMSGAGDLGCIVGHRMCIMQAAAMVSTEAALDPKAQLKALEEGDIGAGGYTDNPICVSEEITEYLINLNDSCTDKERGRLKGLIPHILNTCPIIFKEYKTKPNEEKRDKKNKAYLNAEIRRHELLYPEPVWDPKLGFYTGGGEKRTIGQHIKVVREAADLFRTAPGLVDELL